MNNDFIKKYTSEIDLLKPYLPNNFFKKCVKYDSIFHFSIPKTGSTFLNKALEENYLIKSFSPPHGTCNSLNMFPDPTDAIPGMDYTYYPEQRGFEESLKISIVRNPYDWLVSFYYHENLYLTPRVLEQQGIDINSLDPFIDTIKACSISSSTFGVGSLRKLYKSFEEFVYAYADPGAYWPAGLIGFKNFFPFQIFNDKGECQADYCLRNERLSLATY